MVGDQASKERQDGDNQGRQAPGHGAPPTVSPRELLMAFLRLGALGFGGSYALLALLEKDVVRRRGWLTPEEFSHSVALGTLTPGPLFFSAGVHVGYQLLGVQGALMAGIALLLPGFVAAVVLAALYVRAQDLAFVQGVTRGLTAGVVGLLAAMTARYGRPIARDPAAIAVAVAGLVALQVFRVSPVWVLAGAALAGMGAYGRRRGRG